MSEKENSDWYKKLQPLKVESSLKIQLRLLFTKYIIICTRLTQVKEKWTMFRKEGI